MYKYEEDLFHFGAKKGILGNRAGKVAPNRKSRRQGRPKPEIAPATPAATFGKCTGASTRRRRRLPLLENVPAHQRPGNAGCHFWKLYRRTNAPARPPATFKYCTGALARRCYTILPCFPFYFPQHLFYQLIDI